MATVNNYALVETPFSHTPSASGDHVSTLQYRAGCTHVPTINLGTGNPTTTALTLTVAKSTLVSANDAKYTTCVWGLEKIYTIGNNLTALDVSANPSLTLLNCYTNNLTALNVSANTLLSGLNCFTNSIAALDVSNNTALIVLTLHNNQLTTLNLSTNTALTTLNCRANLFNDAAIDSLIAGMDSVAWTVKPRTMDISSMANAADINTGATCTSLGNLAAEGWVITYEQGTCTV